MTTETADRRAARLVARKRLVAIIGAGLSFGMAIFLVIAAQTSMFPWTGRDFLLVGVFVVFGLFLLRQAANRQALLREPDPHALRRKGGMFLTASVVFFFMAAYQDFVSNVAVGTIVFIIGVVHMLRAWQARVRRQRNGG